MTVLIWSSLSHLFWKNMWFVTWGFNTWFTTVSNKKSSWQLRTPKNKFKNLIKATVSKKSDFQVLTLERHPRVNLIIKFHHSLPVNSQGSPTNLPPLNQNQPEATLARATLTTKVVRPGRLDGSQGKSKRASLPNFDPTIQHWFAPPRRIKYGGVNPPFLEQLYQP